MSQVAKKLARVVEINAAPVATIRGHRVGRIVGARAQTLVVDFPGNPHGPLAALTTLTLVPEALKQVAEQARAALLVFEDERSDRPIVVGLLAPSVDEAARGTAGVQNESKPTEALVDGRRVVLEAQDEIVLRCGEASITLRRNGRVVVRGAYVETRSRGVNRIKGGSVQIN